MGRSKQSFELRMLLWPLGKVQSRLSRHPILRKWIHADISPGRNRHIIIPANQVIHDLQSVVLPPIILDDLIAQASYHVVLNQCLCRRAEHCQVYSRETGCLFLGEAARQIDPELGRVTAPEAAKSYVREAIKTGLTPMIVHSAYDAELLGIEFRRMLAVCFCCDCCCTVRRNLRSGPREFGDTVLRFPGIHVEVGLECNGCGLCIEVCHAHALSLYDNRVVIGEGCKGCGRCALTCPEQALCLSLEDESRAIKQLRALVGERTNIGLDG